MVISLSYPGAWNQDHSLRRTRDAFESYGTANQGCHAVIQAEVPQLQPPCASYHFTPDCLNIWTNTHTRLTALEHTNNPSPNEPRHLFTQNHFNLFIRTHPPGTTTQHHQDAIASNPNNGVAMDRKSFWKLPMVKSEAKTVPRHRDVRPAAKCWAISTCM
jgi:hypothetical protein